MISLLLMQIQKYFDNNNTTSLVKKVLLAFTELLPILLLGFIDRGLGTRGGLELRFLYRKFSKFHFLYQSGSPQVKIVLRPLFIENHLHYISIHLHRGCGTIWDIWGSGSYHIPNNNMKIENKTWIAKNKLLPPQYNRHSTSSTYTHYPILKWFQCPLTAYVHI